MNKHIKHVRYAAVPPSGDDRRRRPFLRDRARRPRRRCRARRRAHRQGAEPMGQHRARRHDHHHVGGDRDGAGVDDLAAADHRRRARRRLVARCAIVPAPPLDEDLRQSGLRRHDVHRRLQRGDELLPAAATMRRAGAPRAARQCRQETRRAGRGADHRAEHRRARQVGPQAELWRDRGVRRSSGQGAGDQAGGAEEARANSG